MRVVFAVIAALVGLLAATLIALVRAQPREVCPLCGRRHPLEAPP